MSPRYIDANLAKAQFTGNFQDSYSPSEAKAMIDEVPSADVAPVIHAHWIKVQWVKDETYQEGGWWISRCSNCIIPYNEQKRYCPNCGAKMDEKENGK